ncbi:MAG: threonylcarbamoyl-AMP synthase [Oscillospiraceae bacterium]|nr:threonylcarbamoyl-AMP synthase [Oscillospiraceae bacterium]
MNYDTQMLSSSDEDIDRAAALLKSGNVVGIPTETVYGLAADALNTEAVAEIFKAKGRPQDNPLIVHIGELSDIYKYVTEVPENAMKLADAFWPGPLTMVLPKKDIIPLETSGGLDTVGIRFPVHPIAREIIRRCGCPLAAPSANLSGSPSPTTAMHVYKDMNGRIPAIVDGGDCAVGVESTVVSFDKDGRVRLLRPGFVSLEDIRSIVGEDNALCAKGVTEKISDGERVLSPGMKYKHYSPKANVTILCGGMDKFTEYVSAHNGEGVCSMIFNSDAKGFPFDYITYGDTSEEQARKLFSVLRSLDDMGAKQVYARCPEQTGVGLAVYNRLLRAAGFEVVNL